MGGEVTTGTMVSMGIDLTICTSNNWYDNYTQDHHTMQITGMTTTPMEDHQIRLVFITFLLGRKVSQLQVWGTLLLIGT